MATSVNSFLSLLTRPTSNHSSVSLIRTPTVNFSQFLRSAYLSHCALAFSLGSFDSPSLLLGAPNPAICNAVEDATKRGFDGTINAAVLPMRLKTMKGLMDGMIYAWFMAEM